MKSPPWRYEAFRHGAVLLNRGKVVAVAYNKTGDHAESRVLRKIPKGSNPTNLTVIVIRANRQGELRPSKPCPNCWAALKKHGIHKRNVHWS